MHLRENCFLVSCKGSYGGLRGISRRHHIYYGKAVSLNAASSSSSILLCLTLQVSPVACNMLCWPVSPVQKQEVRT